MFFDIIKKASDNSTMDAEYSKFKQLINKVKGVRDSIQKETNEIFEGLKDVVAGDPIAFDEAMDTLILWLHNYSDRPITEAQRNIMSIFYGDEYRPSSHDKTLSAISALLLQKEYLHKPYRIFKIFTLEAVRGTWTEDIVNRNLLHILENTETSVSERGILHFLGAQLPDGDGEFKDLIGQIDDWYSALYNKVKTTSDVDLLGSFFVTWKDDPTRAAKALTPYITKFRDLLFQEINQYLNKLISAEKKLMDVFEIITQQVKKMDDLFGNLRDIGAEVKVGRPLPSGSIEDNAYDGITITMGEYFFNTSLPRLLSPEDCPTLQHKPTKSQICIQQDRGHYRNIPQGPMFDTIFTIFALLASRQKGVVPLLDYFIYLTDLGINTEAHYSEHLNIEITGATKSQITAFRRTVEHFKGLRLFNFSESSSRIRTKTLPPINTFINRFRRERKRIQR